MQLLVNYCSKYSLVHIKDSQAKADGCDDNRDGLKAEFYGWSPRNTMNKYLSCGKLWLFMLLQSVGNSGAYTVADEAAPQILFCVGFGALTPRQTLRCWRVCREGQWSGEGSREQIS